MADKEIYARYTPEYRAKLKRRCQAALRKCLPPMREVAMSRGYAIGLHGSVARDIDLIAVPWAPHAAEPAELIDALKAKIHELTGFADWGAPPQPERRPHGRLAYSIVIGGGPYFDISIMPPVAQQAA